MNIFNLPLYYINKTKNIKLESEFYETGFTNVNYFPAIIGKNFDIKKMLNNDLITIRTYRDLINGRTQHEGIPTLGAVGCTMSHSFLWKLCVEKKLPYIIICENDVNLNKKKLTKHILDKIIKILGKNNSIYVSSNIKKNKYNKISFWGLQFYIVSFGACKELIKNIYPIDVQTDYYIAHKHNIGKINVDGFLIFNQKIHLSSIQDTCIKCITPDKNSFYYCFLILLIIIIIIIFYNNYYYFNK